MIAARAQSAGAQRPRGVGVYVRRLGRSVYGTPSQAASSAADHGLAFVAMPAIWQDHRGEFDLNPRAEEEEYAAAFREAGVDVWVWAYPNLGHARPFCEQLVGHARRLGACGVLPDVERAFKRHPVATRRLMELLIDHLDESLGLGVTSYGRLDWHGLEALENYGWLSPQVYTVPPEAARASIRSWMLDASGAPRPEIHMVPSVPTFGPQAEGRLGAYLGAFEDLCQGVIAWSWPTTSRLEWRTLERWANRFQSPPLLQAG